MAAGFSFGALHRLVITIHSTYPHVSCPCMCAHLVLPITERNNNLTDIFLMHLFALERIRTGESKVGVIKIVFFCQFVGSKWMSFHIYAREPPTFTAVDAVSSSYICEMAFNWSLKPFQIVNSIPKAFALVMIYGCFGTSINIEHSSSEDLPGSQLDSIMLIPKYRLVSLRTYFSIRIMRMTANWFYAEYVDRIGAKYTYSNLTHAPSVSPMDHRKA